MTKKIHPLVFLAVGICLMFTAHMTFNIALTAWIAYTPFLIYLNRTSGLRSRLIFFSALFIGWSLVIAKIITPPLVYLFVFLYSIPISLVHLPAFLIYDRFKKQKYAELLFPAILVVSEWIQYAFTPLGSWGAGAYSQADNLLLLQGLSLFGLSGLSFLIYWINVALAGYYLDKSRMKSLIAAPSLILAGLLLYGAIRVHEYNTQVQQMVVCAAVGTDSKMSGLPLPGAEEIEQINGALFERTRKAATGGAQIIVWNEAATMIRPEKEQLWKDSIRALSASTGSYLFASYIVPVDTSPLKYENKYLLADSAGQIVQEYLKHEPVPGEPAVKGTDLLQVHRVAGAKVGGAICYDYDFPYLAKKYGKIEADIMALPSSDWRGIDPLHTKMAAFRAAEQGHSIVRSTRFGLSAAINPIGAMTAQLSSFDLSSKIMYASVPRSRVVTLYALIGDLFVYTLIAFSALIILAYLRYPNRF
jgi:apolipoprotein N-acyltransferase